MPRTRSRKRGGSREFGMSNDARDRGVVTQGSGPFGAGPERGGATRAASPAGRRVEPPGHHMTARVVRSAAAGMVAALGVAVVDASWARGAAEGAHTPQLLPIVLDVVGLVAPVAFVVALGVALFAIFVEPRRASGPRDWIRALRPEDDRRRAALSALVPLVPPALALFATAVAHLAKASMVFVAPPKIAGLAVGVGAIALVALLGAAVLAVQPPLRRAAARGVAPFADPLAGGALGLALAAVLVAFGVAHGTTGGDGGFFGIWGVMKRPELDLRAPTLLACIAAAAWLGPTLLARLPAMLLPLVALAPLVLTARAAKGMAHEQAIAAAIERGASLGKTALAALRKGTDRDRDGASALFGGGDCDDRDPNVGPTAIDVPGNGIDEDCSGADTPVPKEVPRPAPVTPASVRDRIPKDLNLILITVDTLRADLGFAGNPKPLSPNLDALAARSVVFDRAYSLASYTGKSVGPLLSGKYPSETHRGWSHFNSYTKDDVMVAERLHKAGVHTMGFQAHWYFAPFTGLARGFDAWDMSAQPGGGMQPDNDLSITGDKLTDAVVKALSKPEATSSRFFAWVHYVDPHADYEKHPGAPDLGTGMRAMYDGEVWFVDQQIGRLLDWVKEQPWGERTAIVLTSDHGEAFGEHHLIRHGFEVWEELVRVPLVFYVPGVAPHRVEPRRSCIDLVPTILDLMHVEPPGEGAGKFDFLSGDSLLDDLLMPPGHVPDARDVFVDMPAGPNNDERRALIHDDLKLYVSNGVRYQLFDLAADPGETNDVMDDKGRSGPMLALYQQWKGRLREVYVKPIPKEDKSE